MLRGCENDEKKRWKEIDMEGVRQAGEEVKSNKIGENEANEEREGGVGPEEGFWWAIGMAKREGRESHDQYKDNNDNSDEAELEEEAEKLVLDDFFGAGDAIGKAGVHDTASTT